MSLFGGTKKIKKVKEKQVLAFWREFESRADLYLDILAEGDEDSDDYVWLCGMVGKGIKRCAPDGDMAPAFHFDLQRDPPRLVFEYRGDAYLRAVGEALERFFPPSLAARMAFCVAES